MLWRRSVVLVLWAGLFGCRTSSQEPSPGVKWSTGFWFWNGSSASVPSTAEPVDVLFCQAGNIHRGPGQDLWIVSSEWPRRLPPAREYWMVFRLEEHGAPDTHLVSDLSRAVAALQQTTTERGMPVAGIQLDIDSPTQALSQYAAFLRELKKSLPAMRISVTALLDWFRDGTAIGDVLKEVDEYVPQFYDVQDRGTGDAIAIATPFHAARWKPVFNKYRKPFRIGISTFGRSRLVSQNPGQQTGIVIADRLTPLDIAANPAFTLQKSETEAGELVLSYRAMRGTRVGYTTLESGETIQFIRSTPNSIKRAVTEVRQAGDYCAGVVFFRWPSFNETLAVSPRDALAAAGVVSEQRPQQANLQTMDGGCAAVSCVDLYLMNTDPLSPGAISYRIQSSIPFEYFLPPDNLPVRLSGSSRIEFVLPPYGGRSRIYLGRAVTAKPARFTTGEE